MNLESRALLIFPPKLLLFIIILNFAEVTHARSCSLCMGSWDLNLDSQAPESMPSAAAMAAFNGRAVQQLPFVDLFPQDER